MSTERKSFLSANLKRNFAAFGIFLVAMTAALYWLSSGEPEKILGKKRMLQELKEQQQSAADRGPAAGFTVTPLVDDEYFSSLLADLDAAQESIEVLMFEIKLGKSAENPANRLVDAVARAKARDVAVRVRLEQSDLDRSLTSTNRRTAEYLKRSGIHPEFDLPNVETHAKTVLIDGRILYVGNHNWSEAALKKNREVSLRVASDRPISTMKRSFDKFDEALKKLRLSGEAAAAGNVTDVVFLHNEEYLSVLRESIQEAKSSVEIEMYLIRPAQSEGHPVRILAEDLGDARKRGVQVRVLLDRHFLQDNLKAKAWFKRKGVWDVRFDDEDVTNHSKLVIIDDEIVLAGSQNWTLSALVASNETAVYIKDRQVVRELKEKLKHRREAGAEP